jgi:alkylated DNA repair dioxygenase AlkB
MIARNDESNLRAVLPGLKLATEVVTPEEEARLIALVESCNPQRYQGDALGGLRAISYGWKYDLSSAAFSPCDPPPEGFAFVRQIAANFADLTSESFVQCLLNRYEAGAEISWHCDKPIWEDIVGISLGAPTTMGFRRAVQGGYVYAEAELPRRSIYLLSGEVRTHFDHSIPPLKETRWSITFRTFSDEGRRLRDSHFPLP